MKKIVDNPLKSFPERWNNCQEKIVKSLKLKFKWRGRHRTLWEDIVSEAKLVCAEHFHEYDETKGDMYKFFFHWSEIAFQRFLHRYNRTVHGDPPFQAIKNQSIILLKTIRDEGNPRYLLAFLFKYFLEVPEKEFFEHKYYRRTLKELFGLIQQRILDSKDVLKYPHWLEHEFKMACTILWDKITPFQKSRFGSNSLQCKKNYVAWARSVKGNFLKTYLQSYWGGPKQNPLSRSSHTGGEYGENDLTDPAILENDAFLSSNLHLTPYILMYWEEKVDMQLKLLKYVIRNIGDLRYLFALLFNLCSMTTKDLTKLFTPTATLIEMYNTLKETYIGNSSLSAGKLNPIFDELFDKIKDNASDKILLSPNNIDIADWTFKGKNIIRSAIFKKKDPDSVELLTYFRNSDVSSTAGSRPSTKMPTRESQS